MVRVVRRHQTGITEPPKLTSDSVCTADRRDGILAVIASGALIGAALILKTESGVNTELTATIFHMAGYDRYIWDDCD